MCMVYTSTEYGDDSQIDITHIEPLDDVEEMCF